MANCQPRKDRPLSSDAKTRRKTSVMRGDVPSNVKGKFPWPALYNSGSELRAASEAISKEHSIKSSEFKMLYYIYIVVLTSKGHLPSH